MTEPAYMNVWRSTVDQDHQWTDPIPLDPAIHTRAHSDRVALEVEDKGMGIKRMGVLRVWPKPGVARHV